MAFVPIKHKASNNKTKRPFAQEISIRLMVARYKNSLYFILDTEEKRRKLQTNSACLVRQHVYFSDFNPNPHLWFTASLGCTVGKTVGPRRDVEFSSAVKFASRIAIVDLTCLHMR